MLGLYFVYLSFLSLCFCSNPYTFEVKNVNLTIQLLKRLDYESITEDLKEDIHSKLGSWEETFGKDPLLFEHPIRSFLLMKMLRVDIQNEMIPKYLKYQFRKNVKVPTKQELGKSVIVINDMMTMYNISIHEVIKSFNFGDCLTMTEELLDEGLVTVAQLWITAAERNQIEFITKNESNHAKLIELKEKIDYEKQYDDAQERFEKLCSKQEVTMDYEVFRNLSCRYEQDGKNALLKMKIEEMNEDPIVNIVHDFLSIREVNELLKKSSKYEFDTAPTVYDLDNPDDDSPDESRLAVSHYIDEERDNLGQLTQIIKQRMSRITGINMDHSEDFEIVKYRPGGVHHVHVDKYETEEVVKRQSPIYGNRYAQGLIFLSKPKLGGNFVMPLLGISVVPAIGSMVVWHNTDRNGHLTMRSYHGGCKVFVGQKIAGSLLGLVLDQDKAQCIVEEHLNCTINIQDC